MENNETNLEKAKRLTKANAEIRGVVLADDNYFFKMLELAATPDLKREGKEPSNDAPAGGLSKHAVNQQRELLLAFAEYIKTKTLTSLIGEPQHYVRRFLKANNSG